MDMGDYLIGKEGSRSMGDGAVKIPGRSWREGGSCVDCEEILGAMARFGTVKLLCNFYKEHYKKHIHTFA